MMDMVTPKFANRASVGEEEESINLKKTVFKEDQVTSLNPNLAIKEERELNYSVIEFDSMDQLTEATPSTTTIINGPTNMSDTRLTLLTPKDFSSETRHVLMSDGQLYVISDTASTQNTQVINKPKTKNKILTREEKRRVTHNEVERRRRDKINNWICRLAKILPDCEEIHHKNSQDLSKGAILAKACDTITDLTKTNKELMNKLHECEKDSRYELLQQEIEILKSENTRLKNDNAIYKDRLQQQGITYPSFQLGS